jgi:hypothetical protein
MINLYLRNVDWNRLLRPTVYLGKYLYYKPNIFLLLLLITKTKTNYLSNITGAYDDEESAARAYDLAALKYWGTMTVTNFPV